MADDNLQKVKALLAKSLNYDINKMTEESSLADDLGADSLDTSEIAMEVEEQFGYHLSEDEIRQIKTVGDLVAIVFMSEDKK